jgi:excisionase family DNA binding protein
VPEVLLVDVKEAGKMLGIGRTRVYELLSAGAFRSVTIGKLRRVLVSDLRAYVRGLTGDEAANMGGTNRLSANAGERGRTGR